MIQNRLANMKHSRRLEKMKIQREAALEKSEPSAIKQENQAEKSYMLESMELSRSVESPGLKAGGFPRMHSTISNSNRAAENTLDIDNKQFLKQFE